MTAHKSNFTPSNLLDGAAAWATGPHRKNDFTKCTRLTGRCAHRYANLEGLSPWTKDKLSPEEYLRKEVVELNNGRLAMLACIGLWAQELVQHGQPVMFTLLEKVATYEIPALFQEFHQ